MRRLIAIPAVISGFVLAGSLITSQPAFAQFQPMPAPAPFGHASPVQTWFPRRGPVGGFGGFYCPFCFTPAYVQVGWFDTAGGQVYNYGNGYDRPVEYSPPQQSNELVNIQLATAVQHLSDEVDYLRQQRSEADNFQTQAPAPPPAPPQKLLPTTLVFRNGHRATIQNYAVLGGTLWVFQGEVTRKIPLSALDLAATRRANAARGVTFVAPGLD